MLRQVRDRGEGSLSYVTVVLLVAAVTAAITVVAIPDQILGGIRAGVCRVAGDKGCDKPGNGPGTTAPSAGQSTEPGEPGDPGDPGDPSAGPQAAPVGNDTPEGREYNAALAANQKADQDAQGIENEWNSFDMLKEIAKLGLDFIAGDIINCVKNPNFWDCLWAIVGIVPWGKLGKVVKSIPKVGKLIDRFLDLQRRLEKAREARRGAKTRLDDALAACQRKAKPGNSFPPGTTVLMADGSRRPIERVRTGDRVWATDPQSGRTGTRTVTDVIVGDGRKNLVELTIDPDATLGGPTVKLTATAGHPFWVTGTRDWIESERLVFGDLLTTPDGRNAMVLQSRRYQRVQRVYNLTVSDLHTYYVLAGKDPVLVHNVQVAKPPRKKVPLGDKYHGEVDTFNTGGQASWEMHVYYKGREIGVRGPNGWIWKHGFTEPPQLPEAVEKTINDHVAKLNARFNIC
ncbi:polymorphic toxin-type HINT domain-containing protein [Actinomadura macrotermitis]|uniref:Hint domain-containing protein n=1 Tax=Actinomadura macrotermitis TaxID=2585200 RepID=A0A7K0BT52_9ACTN|nr:polymorphic toxin-type HINT domain-containing protein [Actinomadura macrotermitis]MQY03864.1 hypothetical protein [Actinomadura macrotermitis]